MKRPAAARHLLGIAHQLVEMNLGWGDECTSAAPPYDHTLALQSYERVPCGHETNAVNTRKFPLGVYEITRVSEGPFRAV